MASDPRISVNPALEAAMERVLQRVDSLPTLPAVAMRVGDMVNNPDASAAEISEVMRADPALSAKVLQLVNSAYFAIPGGVSDVQRAISFIGFNTLHQLVLSVSVLGALKSTDGRAFNAKGLWLHSLAVGALAEIIARQGGHKDPGACFTAGLLHDVGKIGLAIAAPDEFCAAIERARDKGMQMRRAERREGLPSHDLVGWRLAKRWRFPATLLAPIQYHHQPSDPQTSRDLSPSLIQIVHFVSAADELVRIWDIGDSGSPAPDRTEAQVFIRMGIGLHARDRLYTELMRKLELSKAFLELVEGDCTLGMITENSAPRSGTLR